MWGPSNESSFASVCLQLSLRELRENCTFVKLQCILIMLHVLSILCDIMLFGVILHLSFDFGINILTTYQNSPKSVFFISMGSSFWFCIIWYYVILWTQF